MDANMDDEQKPQTVEEIFRDFDGRRNAIIKALKTDVDEFYQKCDPENGELCLYGYPNGEWEVKMPANEMPPELPEPAIGINFSRDGIRRSDWIRLVAFHSHSWLLSVAFFFGSRLDKTERERLFDMINDQPTVYHIATVFANVKQLERWAALLEVTKNEGVIEIEDDDMDEAEEEEFKQNICGACEEKYETGEFWICCDECERWFHGECVKITIEKAEKMKCYYCPPCRYKSSLQSELRLLNLCSLLKFGSKDRRV